MIELLIKILIIYTVLHYIFLSTIFYIFWIRDKQIFILIFAFILIFTPLAIWLYSTNTTTIPTIFYLAAVYYNWIVLVSSIVFVPYRIIRFKFKQKILAYLSFIWALFLVIISFYSAKEINIKNIEINSPEIKQDFKLAYISDPHIDTINNEKHVLKIVNLINSLNPDINGDLVDGTSIKHENIEWFNKIKSPLYATLWNHETYVWISYFIDLIKDTKIELLRNSKINFKSTNIIFSDQISNNNKLWLLKLKTFLNNSKIKESDYNILIIHEPIWIDLAKRSNIDLQVSWHTHNWQVWPLWYIVKSIYWYNYWMYDLDNMKLYVSSWVWTWWPPFRFLTQNEIVIFNFKKSN